MPQPVHLFDQYTALMHKAGLDPDTSSSWEPPSYLPDDVIRRRHAYRILYSMVSNANRFNMTKLTPAEQRTIREYGDPRLLVDRIVAGILGTGAVVSVRGATMPPLEAPDLPDRPEPPADDADEIELRIAQVQDEVWSERAEAIIEEWAQAHADFPLLEERQRWIDQWWVDEQVATKLYENEAEGAVPLGDGVLVLGWSSEKQRVSLTVYEPDAYVPDLDDANVEDFPTRVHLVWEYQDDDKKRWLRRITYELVELETPRRFPWSTEPSPVECVLTDVTWSLDATGISWPDLSPEAGTINTNEDGDELDQFPIGLDFIPVIHVPNTPSTSGHYGVSSLTNVAQLLDDLASVDTDVQLAGSNAAAGVVGAAGVDPQGVKLTAGTVIPLPENGKLFPLDLAGALRAAMELEEAMLDRLSVNSQVPGVVQGRVSGDQVPSGVALSLSFAPFEQLVGVLRLTRFLKYGLLVKFAQRIAQAAGDLPPGPTPIVDLEFATTIPSDVQATVSQVATLLESSGIPRAVGLTWLRDAGLPIESIEDALNAIASEDTAGAREIADALQSEQAAADYLGVELPEQPTADDGTLPDEATTGDDLPPPLGG